MNVNKKRPNLCKLFKRGSTACVCAKVFAEHVIKYHYQGAINSKYTSVLTVALSDRISFVKGLLTSGIGCPWTVLILVLFIVLEILLMP